MSPKHVKTARSTDVDPANGVESNVRPTSLAEYAEFYDGPIPTPEILRGYRDIQADLPERIVRMAEKAGDAIIEENRTKLKLAENGQKYAAALVFAALVAGVLCARWGCVSGSVAAFAVCGALSYLTLAGGK